MKSRIKKIITSLKSKAKKKMTYEIILILIAGSITAFLSIQSIIKNNNHENELKEKQENLLQTQRELNNKQDEIINLQYKYSEEIKNKTQEIIKLQNQLYENASNQLNKIERIQNPIPNNSELSFNAEIELSEFEKKELQLFLKDEYIKTGIILPYKRKNNYKILEKFDVFQDIGLQINISLENKNNKLNISFIKSPLSFFGYHGLSDHEYFNANINNEKVVFECYNLRTSDIKSSNIEASINDFKESIATITYSFIYPSYFNDQNSTTKFYGISPEQRSLIKLIFGNINLSFKSYSINIKEIQKINNFTFQGKAKIK